MKPGFAQFFSRRREQRTQERAAQRAVRQAGQARSSDPLERDYAAMLQGLEALRGEDSRIRDQARAAWLKAGHSSRSRTGVALLAATACACALWFLGVPLYRASVPQFEASYAPPVSGRAAVALPDGSRLQMNVDARASVRYYADRREVTLHEGEAYFSVERDPVRYFDVVAGTARVRVTGTRFNVRLLGNRAEVAVKEGTVLVMGSADDGQFALSTGQRLRIAGRIAESVLDEVPPEMIGAWKDGFLAVYRLPLADLPDELARYHAPRIEIATGIGKLQISGAFRLDDFDALVEAIAGIHPVRVERFAGGIRLFPAIISDAPLQPPLPVPVRVSR